MSFILDSYRRSAELCKSLGLWDIEHGLILRGILQHCLPPPTLEYLLSLITILKDCEVNTDWAPLDKVQDLHKRLKLLSKSSSASQHDPESIPNWRTQFPVFYGIKRFSEQSWEVSIRAKAICDFAEVIHEQLGQIHSQDIYYKDVYSFRDFLIIKQSEQLKVKPRGKLDGNYTQKVMIYQEIRKGRQIGYRDIHDNPHFWSSVPEIKLQWSPGAFNNHEQSLSADESKDTDDQQSSPLDALKNNEQQQNVHLIHPIWLRDNVRSLADFQQLSWAIIFKYWAMLLDKNRNSLFKLSYLTFLTGVRKNRWQNYLTRNSLNLTDDNLRLRIDDESNSPLLEYRVKRGATQFDQSMTNHRILSIRLPRDLVLDASELKCALNEHSILRTFKRNNPGPTPHLSNMALSSHNLLSHLQSEIESFILAGQIPIEFQARAAYFTIGNKNINTLLNHRVSTIISLAKQYQPNNKSLHQALKAEFSLDSIKNNQLGSQLGEGNFLRPNTHLKTNRKSTTTQKVQLLNELELYAYWMDAYCFAGRPKGDETERLNTLDTIFHKDKDSSDYKESKVLLKPTIYKQQEIELQKARDTLLRHCKKYSIKLRSKKEQKNLNGFTSQESKFFTYSYNRKKKAITLTELNSQLGLRLVKNIYGITPNLERSNSHRHQCATFAHQMYSEEIADAWLGHHIDGHYFAAPESSASINVLNKVQEAQERILDAANFRLIKNPL